MRHRFVRATLLAVGLTVAALAAADDARAERRVALVIGNGAYGKVPALPNPPNDAKAMSALLRSLNFDVVSGIDLTRDGMADTLRKFAMQAQGADVALFFYAGHGLQLDGKNYLLPVDANLTSELDVKLGGPIDLDTMLQQTMAEAKVKLVLLDACRDNPFVGQIARSVKTRTVAVSSGLAEMKSGEGTLLAFATGPGQVALDGDGGNSPFTRALLDNLAKPGLEIRLALTHVRADVVDRTRKQQTPWENTNLTGFFYMTPDAAPAPAANAPAAAAVPAATNDVELEFWRSVKDSKNSEELNAYLIRYPNGSFASIARSRIAEIQVAKAEPPAVTSSRAVASSGAVDQEKLRTEESSRATEDALGLDSSKRRIVERRLTALGFASGAADGKFDEATRRALRNWQGARGYNAGGYLNKVQYEALTAEPVPAAALAEGQPKSRGGGGGSQRPAGLDAGAAAAIGFIGGAIIGGALRR